MKKILFLSIITNVWLSVICQNTDQQITKQTSYVITDTYTFLGIFDNTIAHLVWENNPDPDIFRVQVERSFDSINYSSLASANIKSLLDLHAENYNPYIKRHNSILMSSEHGNIRFIYNDVIPGSNLNEIKLWYRVIMYTTSGLSYSSPVIRSKTVHGNQKQSQVTQPELFNGATVLKGGNTRACPPVGTPPSGYTPCGPAVNNSGQCCNWVEQPYATDAVSIACGGGSYAWCCNNVPEAPGCASLCTSGYASDPCCVHYCNDYASCSCPPWECCTNSQTMITVVTSSTPLPGITISGNVQDETCAGLSDGSITITVNNPTPPVTYIWSNFAITQNLTNIPGGNYSVTATDAAGCTNTFSFTVGSHAPITLITSSTDEHCGHSDGTATVIASGGYLNYTFIWSTIPPQTTSAISNLSAGSYTVTVTDSFCTTIGTAIISNLPGPSVSITNIINEICSAGNGSAFCNASDGTPGYTYQWNSNPVQYTQTLQNVHAGTYNITVADANNCLASNSVTITDSPPPTASATSTPEICFRSDGTVTVTANGGSGTYAYNWNTNPPQTTQTAINLPSGTYTVTVVDTNNCTVTTSGSIVFIPGPTADFFVHPKVLTILDVTASFLDNSSGNIVSWQWTLGDGSTESGIAFDHNYNSVGTYIVTLIVTDNNGCKDTVSDTIKVKDIFTLYIPNTFTPNGDGFNEFFFPQGVNVDPNNFDMYIFDRWGNLMFHTTTWVSTHGEPWNGTKNNSGTIKDVVMDVYVYRILTKEIQGPRHEYIGRVTLIR